VIYGMMANTSIGALFHGGVIPGVVMTLLMMADRRDLRASNGWGGRRRFPGANGGRRRNRCRFGLPLAYGF
jgi:TRAP-type C4-dicarboxylate transport system permease large subunit